MMWNTIGALRPQIQYKFWASAGHGQSLEELAKKMEEIGNSVILVDEENERLLVMQCSTEVWGCIICFEEGEVIIVDSEKELYEHCDDSHPGWRNINATQS